MMDLSEGGGPGRPRPPEEQGQSPQRSEVRGQTEGSADLQGPAPGSVGL